MTGLAFQPSLFPGLYVTEDGALVVPLDAPPGYAIPWWPSSPVSRVPVSREAAGWMAPRWRLEISGVG